MQEIFERTNGDAPGYRFKVELVQRWIERDKPLTLVKQSLA